MNASITAASPSGSESTGHPKGLYLLFSVEMWERMSYYGMRALLSIYMIDKARGGFGWTAKDALSIYGTYTGLVYLSPLLGGFIADRFLGQRRAVVLGGVLMMIGHFLMAVPGTAAFYCALGFLIFGNGFFKPNISTMVGGLYRKGDARRDAAFTIFYMGVNLGAFLAPLVCGTLGEKVGWHYGFAAAGVGMGLGLINFLYFAKRLLGTIGLAPAKRELGVVVENKPLTREEKDRMTVILVLAAFVIIFWMGFEQAGGLLSIYAEQKVDRAIFGWVLPTSWLQAVNPMFIFILGPLFATLWTNLGRSGKDLPIPIKMALGLIFAGVGFVVMLGAASQTAGGGKAALGWLVVTYFVHTLGELCLSPVGLSMVTKLAPVRYASLCMGAWYLSNAIANKLSGFVGGFAAELGEFQIFAGLAGVAIFAGVVLIGVSRPLRRMMHGACSHLSAEARTSTSSPSSA